MLRLLKIELRKILPYKPLWILFGVQLALFVPTTLFMEKLANMFLGGVAGSGGEENMKAIIFTYPNIWNNLAYAGSWYVVFVAILIVTLVTNEFQFRTLRQNVIDGYSKLEVLIGKQIIIVLITLASTLFIFIYGLIMGEQIEGAEVSIFEGVEHLAMYALTIFTYLNFAYLIASFTRSAGLGIIFIFIYRIVEWIAQACISKDYAPYLPANAISIVIPNPVEVQSQMAMGIEVTYPIANVFVCVGYAALFIGLNYLLLQRGKLVK